MYYFNLKTQA